MARLSSLFSGEQRRDFLQRKNYKFVQFNLKDEKEDYNPEGDAYKDGVLLAFQNGQLPDDVFEYPSNYTLFHEYGIDEVFEREMEKKLLFE